MNPFKKLVEHFQTHPANYLSILPALFLLSGFWFIPGYIQLLDLTVGPALASKAQGFTGFDYLLHWLAMAGVLETGQKVILVVVLWLATLGCYRLLDKYPSWTKISGSLLYIINPFVYYRMITGQINVIIILALLPWALRYIIALLETSNTKNCLRVGVITAAMGLFAPHGLLILAIIYAIAFIAYLWKTPTWQKKLFSLPYLLIILAAVLMVNSFWIIPAIQGKGYVGEYLTDISHPIQNTIYQTITDSNWGLGYNVLGLYGFWAENNFFNLSNKSFAPWWPYLLPIILFVIILGALSTWKQYREFSSSRKTLIVVLSSAALLGFFLSLGIASPLTKSPMEWLYRHFVPLQGFRDSHKFLVITIIGYGYFYAAGLEYLAKKTEIINRWKLSGAVLGIGILIPFLYTPGVFGNFHGVVQPAVFPQSWATVQTFLNNDQTDYRVLVFPWHQYQSYAFLNNKKVANLATVFFNNNLIVGDNVEFGVYSTSRRKESKITDLFLVLPNDKKEKMATTMAYNLNVKYIILTKEVDWNTYLWLDKADGLEKVFDSKEISLYENKRWKTNNSRVINQQPD
ncbi:MAG: hypothetical protein V1707_00465 [bacterium]